MKFLPKLESVLESLFEGTFLRIFRPRVQPAEIARRLERSMEANATVGIGRMMAPNYYEVVLNPRDCETYERYRTSLERELATYVQDKAREVGFSIVAKPQVKILARNDVARGSVHVESWLQDVEDLDAAQQVEFTQPIQVARVRAREPQQATVTAVAGTQAGQRFILAPGRTRVGRGLDNEVIIEDSRVSRTHAEFFLRGNEWYLRDLNSTNGTYVNGYGIRERALENGDRISLGGAELVFHNRG